MSKSKRAPLILSEVKQYVQEFYAKRLTEEGFVSLDENDFRWCRIINGEIFNSVCFFTRYSTVPVWLQIGYGMHPFFREPYIPKHPYIYDLHEHEEIFSQQFLFNLGSNSLTVEDNESDSLVVCINQESKETYTFDNIILPRLEKGKTIEDCYALHKQHYMNLTFYPVEQRFGYLSETFIDEAIYVDDREVYPYLLPTLDKYIRLYQDHIRRKPNNKEYLETYALQERLKSVLEDGGREEYLAELALRTEMNKNKFKKKWKIEF